METLVLMKPMGVLTLELDPDAALAAQARIALDGRHR